MAKSKLDFDELARGLGAERRGQVKAGPGYFGAAQLATELAHRLRAPATGGRPTDPSWTERRIVPLRRTTLERLNVDANRLGIEPMQLAAFLIEKGLDSIVRNPSGQAPMIPVPTPSRAEKIMKKKRKHHHVWQTYLRGWAHGEKVFCLREGRVFESGLMGVANKRDFYKPERLSADELVLLRKLALATPRPHIQAVNAGWLETLTLPFRIVDMIPTSPTNIAAAEAINAVVHNYEEDLHAKVESDAIKYLDALRRRDASFFAIADDCADFLLFACLQYTRTARMQHAIMEATARDFPGLRLERIWKVLRYPVASNIAWVIYAERANWRMIFLDNRTGRPFVAGDQPIVNTYAMASLGEEPTKLEFYYPLSPRLGLLITERPELANRASLTMDLEQVNRYNSYIAQASYEQVFADSPEVLEQISAGLY